MANAFASGSRAIAECDRCGFRFLLKQLKKETVKTKIQDLLVCPQCWSEDHPQLQLGMWPVEDPQALRDPRPDRSYVVSGQLANGSQGEGSRNIQWGWNPVGGASNTLTPNYLALAVSIGVVTVTTS